MQNKGSNEVVNIFKLISEVEVAVSLAVCVSKADNVSTMHVAKDATSNESRLNLGQRMKNMYNIPPPPSLTPFLPPPLPPRTQASWQVPP